LTSPLNFFVLVFATKVEIFTHIVHVFICVSFSGLSPPDGQEAKEDDPSIRLYLKNNIKLLTIFGRKKALLSSEAGFGGGSNPSSHGLYN
jgi:hypothetical protein